MCTLDLPSLAALCDFIPSQCDIILDEAGDEAGDRGHINVAPGSEQQAAQLTRVLRQLGNTWIHVDSVMSGVPGGGRMGASSSARMMRALGEGIAQRAGLGHGARSHVFLYNFRLDRAGMQVKGAGC